MNEPASSEHELTAFLRGEHRRRTRRLLELRETLRGLASSFKKARITENGEEYWPYEDPAPSREFSLSTQAMCLEAATRLAHVLTPDERAKAQLDVPAWRASASDQIAKALATTTHIESRTYGADSPLVALWFLRADVISTVSPAVIANLENVLADPDKNSPIIRDDNDAGQHAFPLLASVQLARRLWPSELSKVAICGKWFLRRLHEQLAYERFQDFKFDAAELTFSLLGALETGSIRWQSDTVWKVLSVVRNAQNRSVYWRPYRPFLATGNGMNLLNISIEVANALIQIIEFPRAHASVGIDEKDRWSRRDQVERRFLEHITAFDDYYNWLADQRQNFGTDGASDAPWYGWLSENVQADPALPRQHLWVTAQATLFLLNYHRLLKEVAHRDLLERSRLSVKLPVDDLKRSTELLETDAGRVDTTAFPHGYVLDLIRKDYVEPRLAGSAARLKYSILFSGPPGAAKTATAESIARDLDWPLITITPSEFLTEGIEQVELRAKSVFDVLLTLENVVILFDEIDQLVPDRDAQDYPSLQGVLKFMTPSMLVKLNDLRRAEKNIFVLSTNYAERIDAAIKRPGRFDDHLFIGPADLAGRRKYFGAALSKHAEAAAIASLFATYPEMHRLAMLAADCSTDDAIRELFRQFEPSTARHFERRVDTIVDYAQQKVSGAGVPAPQVPYDEIVVLLGLILETRDAATPTMPMSLAMEQSLSRATNAFFMTHMKPVADAILSRQKFWTVAWKERVTKWLLP